MTLSRRSFVRTLGLSGAGLATAPLIGARGREALAAELRRGASAGELRLLASPAAGRIRLSSNENPRGPGKAALDGLRDALGEASRYPSAGPDDLRAALATFHRVGEDHVLLGCGSTEILRVAVDVFTSATRPLVTASPTFEEVSDRAQVLGLPVRAVPVDGELRLDLATMAAQAPGAGLVFLNNPNNPTGTLHGARGINDFVARVLRESPGTTILIDEAYHEYVEDDTYATALPLALEHPRVIVSRTFSKAYGIAGLRIGYAIARPETLGKMGPHMLGVAINVLGAGAARAALGDQAGVERERRLNTEAREFTRRWFESAGYRVADTRTNFLMARIRRDAKQFQAQCREHDVFVGRPFPPLTDWARISIGTMDEMRAAVDVFKRVLA